MYDCLPMYHSVGGVVATGALLVRGGSVLIRDKFSAQHFWDDVVDGGCTLFQYIGELCRYLVNAPDHPRSARIGCGMCCGNGLRADVWEKFQPDDSPFRAFWNSTPQPKAMFRSTTSKARSAPSAAFRHSSRTAFRCAA